MVDILILFFKEHKLLKIKLKVLQYHFQVIFVWHTIIYHFYAIIYLTESDNKTKSPQS